MPVLRCLPPASCRENGLLAIYHDRLRVHWRWTDRILGSCLAALGIGTGWSATERRFLPPGVRLAGLSMADRRGVHRILNPSGCPLSGNILRNKALFAHHLAEHQLPAPVTFDPMADDLGTWLEMRHAIIAKPGYSSKGRGVAAFRRSSDRWHGPVGTFDTVELAGHLLSYLARYGVVQELLVTHEQLADLSPGALPTLRIVTCRDEKGEPEDCVTVLRLGSGVRPVDNFNSGGLAVRLDRSGRCEAAFRASGRAAETISFHPATGARIVGFRVPNLEDAVALAKRAHGTLPDGYAVVGWDIGLTERGPMLVEGNWNPGTDIIQLVDDVGLDQTRLGELYRFHLKRTPDHLWRAARAIEW